jgi:hypothetical protein
MSDIAKPYRDVECTNCGRVRVEMNGVCEKCDWDNDNGNYASITRRPTDEVHPKTCDCIDCYFANRYLNVWPG